jgi:hypothetical protein
VVLLAERRLVVEHLEVSERRGYGVVGVNSLTVIFNPRTRFISITANITTIFSPSFLLQLSQIAGVSNGQ